MSLSRRIEQYIKKLLEKHGFVEVQRSELAEAFQCVPSQINYVLGTRFTPSQGYLVESRRGGGGYLRIVKLSWVDISGKIFQEVYNNLGMQMDQWEAEGVLRRLKEEELITLREYHILKAVINRDVLQIGLPQRDIIRSRIIQAALAALGRIDND